MKTIVKMFFVGMVILWAVFFSAVPECAENDYEYYISEQGVDGKIMKWENSISGIKFRNDQGDFAILYDDEQGVTKDITASGTASAGAEAVTFMDGLSIPEGIYTENWVKFKGDVTFRGYIKIDDDSYYYTQSGTMVEGEAGTATEAENSAEDLLFPDAYDGVWERVNVDEEGHVVISADKDYYKLFIKWNMVGLESNRGVGLVWDKSAKEFRMGMMSETFTVIDSDGNEEGF